MYFFQLNHRDPVGWISLNAAQYGQLFKLYSSSWKNFKDKFFKVKLRKSDPLC